MGALDAATGVYIYDETDSQATFSGLLNLGQNATKGAVATLQAQLAGQSYTAPNFAYNGNFDHAQRGTSFTSTGYCLDRWHATLSNVTVSRSTLAATDSYLLSQYGLTLTATASSNSARVVQAFPAEDVARMRGQVMTFSVAARGSTPNAQLTVAIERSSTPNVASSGSWTTIASTTSAPGSTGGVVSVTGTIPAGSSAAGIRISVSVTNLVTGTSITISMAQFEYGATRSPFKLRNLSREAELQSCLTFYYRNAPGQTLYPSIGLGQATGGTTADVVLQFPVMMRSSPALTGWQGLAVTSSLGGVIGASSISVAAVTPWVVRLGVVVPGGLTAGAATDMITNNTAAGFIEFSAELP